MSSQVWISGDCGTSRGGFSQLEASRYRASEFGRRRQVDESSISSRYHSEVEHRSARRNAMSVWLPDSSDLDYGYMATEVITEVPST